MKRKAFPSLYFKFNAVILSCMGVLLMYLLSLNIIVFKQMLTLLDFPEMPEFSSKLAKKTQNFKVIRKK